ncbi:helix-turn-helix transcriptional regulator [Flavobacterium sp. NG2]|uniref:helix-turn-helix transcriptional regulator n=1 Tax=Flavobacterium sp. NG2 TaxID=3097547 RepID=UPI002A7EA991|nr:helix-turn-helix transcriptional regulator [Flavobacterium sp. NG2]WPR70315.1 helix-turn-helix transcriptional regulator [Flavobacterium sp. NG2]
MNSNLTTIPDDFNIGSADTMIYFYSNNHASANNKVVFTKNMICLLQHGCKEIHTALGKEILSSDEALIMTNGSALMSESLADNGKYEAILIFFGNDTLAHHYQEGKHSQATKIETPPILKIKRDEFLNNYCLSLKLLQKHQDNKMEKTKVHELLSYLKHYFPEVFEQLIAKAFIDNSEIKIKQVVELNTNSNLTIEELAFLSNMSLSSFKRHFALIYGTTPQKYFTNLKMQQAKVMLHLNNKPSEVALQVGYENLSSFSKEFKKHFGVAPKYFQLNEPLGQVFEQTE